MADLCIDSDGTPLGTTLWVDDKPVDGAIAVQWEIRVDELARATVTFDKVRVKVGGELPRRPWWRFW